MVGLPFVLPLLLALVQDAPIGPSDPPAPDLDRVAGSLLDDPPLPFVPLRPRTADDRDRVEALRLFAAARAQEKQADLPAALDLLERASKKAPNSVAILKRQSRLSRALGRVDESVQYSRKVLELDPQDTGSIILLVGYFLEGKNDPNAADNLIREVLEDPRLDPKSHAAILARRIQGDLNSEFLGNPEVAADAYRAVFRTLEGPDAADLSDLQRRQILRDNPAATYQRFGEVFLLQRRFDDAQAAFRRGLNESPRHPLLPRLLAEAQLGSGRPATAIETLEDYLTRRPQGREAYELLGRALEALGREEEFLGRLESAAKADPRNIPLQFALAERYRALGREGDAEALVGRLLRRQGDPQVFGPLAASLLNERKAAELVRLIRDGLDRRGGPEALMPQVEAIAREPEAAVQVLDAALALFEAEPEKFGDRPRKVFALIANQAELADRLIALDRLVVKHDPRLQTYFELGYDLFRHRKYDEAVETFRELLERYPDERNALALDLLARSLFFAGQIEAALESAREAEKLEPNNRDTALFIGYLLGRLDRHDEAIAHYQRLLERFAGDDDIERRARSGLSAVYVDLEDFAKGEAELEVLLEKDQDDPVVNNDLGYLYADQGKNLERAEAMIRKALEAEPENSSYRDSLGWVLYKLGRYEEALVPLEAAASDPGVDATIFDHLGDVYFRLESYEKARDAWTRAEEIAARSRPPDKRLTSIRKKLEELSALLGSASPRDPAPDDPSP